MRVERGPRIGVSPRLWAAGAGGAVMGVGAVLARGCTSGQALTGGALLSVGAGCSSPAAFAAAYVVAYRDAQELDMIAPLPLDLSDGRSRRSPVALGDRHRVRLVPRARGTRQRAAS